MATYKEIHGVKVQYRDSDATAIEGDVWYNATTGLLKMYASAGSWSTAHDVNTARLPSGSAGITTAALIEGGLSASPGVRNESEEYNGSAWAEGDNLNTARRYGGGAGSQTAAISAGGSAPDKTDTSEEYDGTNWAEGNALTTARENLINAMAGQQTAAILIGGEEPGGAGTLVEKYNGTSWTESDDVPGAMMNTTSLGTTTACLASLSGEAYTYDGSSWTAIPDSNVSALDRGGSGTTTAALNWGGAYPGGSATTETYDGSSWTEVNDLNANVYGSGQGSYGATSSSTISSAGKAGPAYRAGSEIWDVAATIETIAFD